MATAALAVRGGPREIEWGPSVQELLAAIYGRGKVFRDTRRRLRTGGHISGAWSTPSYLLDTASLLLTPRVNVLTLRYYHYVQLP